VAVRIGKDATISTLVKVQAQVKTGIFIQLMPGARILNTVTRKFTPVSSVPSPDNCNAQM